MITFGLGLEKAGNNPELMRRAFDLGIRFFDTAPTYSNGANEAQFAEALKNSGIPRSEVIISTKTHIRQPDGALALLNRSLSELQTDYVDIWSIHDLASKWDAMIIPALEEAKNSGKARHIGVTCNRDPSTLKDILSKYAFDYVMMTMNIADKHKSSFITEVLPYIDRSRTKIIAMQIFMRGKSNYQVIPYLSSEVKSKTGIDMPEHPNCVNCYMTPLICVAYMTKPVTAKWVCPKCGYSDERGAINIFQIYQDCVNYVASYNPDVMLMGFSRTFQLEETWVAFNNISPLTEAQKAEMENKTKPFKDQLNFFKQPLRKEVI